MFEQRPNVANGHKQRLRGRRRDGVAMIPLRKQGRLGQYGFRRCSLQNCRVSVRLVADEVHAPIRDKEKNPNRIASVEQMLALCEGLSSDCLGKEVGNDLRGHDSHHVASGHWLAR